MRNHKERARRIVGVFTAIMATAAIGVAQDKPASAIATEYAWTGDDGLTLGFREALESALEASQDFAVGRAGAREKLRLSIPSNLYGAEIGGRLNFQYVVIFTNQDSKYLGVSIGSWWTERAEIASCAATVLREATEAWKRRSSPQAWPGQGR
jgi:hypothetical protein